MRQWHVKYAGTIPLRAVRMLVAGAGRWMERLKAVFVLLDLWGGFELISR